MKSGSMAAFQAAAEQPDRDDDIDEVEENIIEAQRLVREAMRILAGSGADQARNLEFAELRLGAFLTAWRA